MTAPSVVYVKAASSGTLTSDGDITGSATGDLVVLCYMGSASGSGTLTGPTYTTGGADAGFTQVRLQTAASSGRVAIYAKRLVSGDYSGGNLKGWTTSNGTFSNFRACVYVFHDNDGVGWGDLAGTGTANIYASNTNDGTTKSLTLSNPSPDRSVVYVGAYGATAAANSQTYAWDGGSARAPYCDEGSGTTTSGAHGSHYGTGSGLAQSDYQEYATSDTPASVDISGGLANTTHALVVQQFLTAAANSGTGSVSGGGTFSATGVRSVIGTASRAGGGTITATGTRTVIGTASVSGGGTIHAERGGLVTGTATVAGGGAITARQAIRGTTIIAGGNTITAAGDIQRVGTATVSGGGTISADGVIGAIPEAADGTWHSGAATLETQTWANATAALAGGGTVHATGQKFSPHQGLGQLLGGGRVAATGTRVVVGTASIEITMTLTALESIISKYRATLDQTCEGTLDQHTHGQLELV